MKLSVLRPVLVRLSAVDRGGERSGRHCDPGHGRDTGSNLLDLANMAPTPGAANAAGVPLPFADSFDPSPHSAGVGVATRNEASWFSAFNGFAVENGIYLEYQNGRLGRRVDHQHEPDGGDSRARNGPCTSAAGGYFP